MEDKKKEEGEEHSEYCEIKKNKTPSIRQNVIGPGGLVDFEGTKGLSWKEEAI